jgi:hypothetical protein
MVVFAAVPVDRVFPCSGKVRGGFVLFLWCSCSLCFYGGLHNTNLFCFCGGLHTTGLLFLVLDLSLGWFGCEVVGGYGI